MCPSLLSAADRHTEQARPRCGQEEAASSQHSEEGGPGRPAVREDSQRRKHLNEDLPFQNVPFLSCPVSAARWSRLQGLAWGNHRTSWGPIPPLPPHFGSSPFLKSPLTYFSLSVASASLETCAHTRGLWPGDSSGPGGGGPTPGCWGQGRFSKCLHRGLAHL